MDIYVVDLYCEKNPTRATMSEPSLYLLYLSLPHPRRYSTRMIDPKKASEAENAESRASQEENFDTNQTEADKPQGLLGWVSRIPQLFSLLFEKTQDGSLELRMEMSRSLPRD